ncbi:hypothetical protein ACTJJM_04830 [Stenotrophomonas sp. 22692]|uniref:hypothetical protein n=1 Tax=Stenotrophomonas sp. 22692 TaxID=3453956 RepID=UPI003F82B536
MHKSTALSTDLRAAAKALQAGIADPNLAIVLNALAAAVEKPTGYTLRLLGGIDHTTFEPTAAAAKDAAQDMQYREDEYTVVPLLCVPDRDPS